MSLSAADKAEEVCPWSQVVFRTYSEWREEGLPTQALDEYASQVRGYCVCVNVCYTYTYMFMVLNVYR
jgi:hypothetical protein